MGGGVCKKSGGGFEERGRWGGWWMKIERERERESERERVVVFCQAAGRAFAAYGRWWIRDKYTHDCHTYYFV